VTEKPARAKHSGLLSTFMYCGRKTFSNNEPRASLTMKKSFIGLAPGVEIDKIRSDKIQNCLILKSSGILKK
jgi:hypothetical protein